MKVVRTSWKIVLFFSVLLITLPFLLVKSNLLFRNFTYSGSVHDALGMGTVDLVELRAEGRITYTDKDGKFSLTVSRPVFGAFQESVKDPEVEVVPTFNFEGGAFRVPCRLVSDSLVSAQVNCSVLLYPTPSTVASRVLSTEINQGLFSAPEITLRKLSLWDLISEESQRQWRNKEEFLGTLVSQETDRVKVKTQPIGYSVSRTAKFFSNYKYLGKILIRGEIASVEATITDASGKITNADLYFIKKDKIWRYLMPDRRSGRFF